MTRPTTTRTLAVRLFIALPALWVTAFGAAPPAFAQPAPGAAARPPGDERAVLVLPFANLTDDPSADWIGAGIAEAVAVGLYAQGGMRVMRSLAGPPTGNGAQVDASAAAVEAGLLMGAGYVISGSHQRANDQIRLIGRLLDTSSGTVLGQANVTGAMDTLFELQDRVTAELAASLAAVPSLAQARQEPPSAPAARVSASPGADPAETTAPAAAVDPTTDPVVAEAAPPAARAADPLAAAAPARAPAPAAPTAGPRAVPASGPGRPAAVPEGAAIGPELIDGPAAPVPPAVMNRDEQGRTTVRAIRLEEGIRLDGVLDEPVYETVPAITDFIQQVPVEGAAATERTEAWIMFDATNVYVSARVWDSAPESEWVANEMRRDTSQLRQNDTFTALFDTFYDRRNGFNFYTNPLGARADQQFTNEGNPNSDWNPVWDVRSGRFDGGWTVEMEIPFKTLRYRSEPPHVWGIQLRRAIRRKNEWVYLTRLPISAGGGLGSSGIFRISSAGTLVGLDPPPASRNIEVKPYAIGGVTTDLAANPALVDRTDGEYGLDVKYGITQNLTADFTYNTDFAQVEVDEQQVNLTRFNLFFPEKREFFLEGRGIFGFARGGVTGRIGRRPGGGGGIFGGLNVPQLFYSRRIGLEQAPDGRSRVVPIVGGARVTGKIGPFDVGALNIHADSEAVSRTDPTNFTVVRLKRDILRRSAVGAIFTNRSVSRLGPGSSQAYGVDGTFAFHDNLSMIGYVARTRVPGRSGKDFSYQGKFEYSGDRYGLDIDHLVVEDNFIPEVGFLRRDNFRRTFASGRFSPRPRSIEPVRQFSLSGSIDYILTADVGHLETRQNLLTFQTEFETSDRLIFTAGDNYELLVEPFTPPGADFAIPVGGYSFADVEVAYAVGQQRRINGQVAVKRGGYFGGELTTLSLSRGRIAVLPQMSVEPVLSFNWIDTPYGKFQTNLGVTRVNYAFNPRMFFSGLLQYNSASDTVSSNLRLRWEYSPGSELFVVYTEDRDVTSLRPDRLTTDLRNRGFVIKLNRLFRF